MNRLQNIIHLNSFPEIDVLIIGGGVNGIGTFRDLALNGVNVLLVEKRDFCSGASAASSHMAHGGIRYLENGEFRLVREAVRERNRLLVNAPHYVKPLPTTIPIFKRFSGLLNAPLKFFGQLDKPGERGALVIKLGLMMYDAYTGRSGVVPRHRFSGPRKSLSIFSKLNPDIVATASYFDGLIEQPERLCMEMILDAETSGDHARAVNYLSAVDSAVGWVKLKDELTGEYFKVCPKIVINAAGPWVDLANGALGKKTDFIGGTKGSHLVLNHPELFEAVNGHEFFFENDDGRIVLILPWLGRVMIGTTDIKVDQLEDVHCTKKEVDYFLGMIARVFPSITVQRSHIVFAFSGVRPLPAGNAATPGQISRDHSIRETVGDFPVLSLVGGKWTTFRAFSEQAADRVLAFLKKQRIVSTADMAIGGGKDYPGSTSNGSRDSAEDWIEALREKSGLPGNRVRELFLRYGTYAGKIIEYIASDQDEALVHAPAYSRREIGFLVLNEKVVHLDDLLFRRSSLAMRGEHDEALLSELIQVIGQVSGWGKDEEIAELERTRNLLQGQHGHDV